jgi:hypothetical protein
MRWLTFTIFALLGGSALHGGSIEQFAGEVVTGKVELDFSGIVFRPNQGAAVKMDFNNLYRVQLDNAAANEFVPGVMLRDGSRLAAPFGPLNEPTVQFPKRKLAIPSAEIAWIIYQRFPATLAAKATAGQTGALLPGGDFFSGTVRGADAEAVKVFNSIFGLRRLEARQHEVFAAVLQTARPLAALYEIRTTDGSLFGAENFGADHTGLILRSPIYDSLKLSADEITELRAGTNRCRPLATLPQLHAEPSTGLSVAPEGALIMDTKTVTTCPVPPGFTEFVARVAPGEGIAAGQRLVFTIYADGNPVGRSSPLTIGDPSQPLRVGLNGVRDLTLRIESTGSIGKVASGRWLQALFLRR